MKWIRRDILPNTNTKNEKVACEKEIQNKKIIKPKISPKYFKTWPFKKESYLQEMLGWIESERRSYQILKFIGLA